MGIKKENDKARCDNVVVAVGMSCNCIDEKKDKYFGVAQNIIAANEQPVRSIYLIRKQKRKVYSKSEDESRLRHNKRRDVDAMCNEIR